MKPMLAGDPKGSIKSLKYPLFVSPKLDGVRCIIKDGQVLSRSLKPIPNKHVQRLFGLSDLNGLDGELIVDDITAENVFQATQSGVMSVEGEPDVIFHVFDSFEKPDRTYGGRKRTAKRIAKSYPYAMWVHQTLIKSEKELLEFEQKCLAIGYEGVMIRSLHGTYKFGRSTVNEGFLLKLKRFKDSEAEIVEVKPLMVNQNEATEDKLGHKVRSSKKDGMVETEQLGSVIVKDLKSGLEFGIGSGFSAVQRKRLWESRDSLKGAIIKYKYQEVGVKEKPRFPVFIGFRAKEDL